MKKSTILFPLLLAGILIYSCTKNDNEDELKNEFEEFVFTAKKNDEKWTATKGWGYFYKGSRDIVFTGAAEDSVYYQEEDLSLSVNYEDLTIGQKNRNIDASFRFVVGGDQVALSYIKTDNPDDSYIIIEKIDTVNKIIEGKFIVSLKREYVDDDTIIRMTNGRFNMKYEDRQSIYQ
ncbi:MAG: hypothetical protein JXJ22_17590 [Bacteroidales bacterium]|nr:hypothetical protein [Bacteroidales bacterium]